MSRKYEWWAWSSACGIISPHFESKAKAITWMKNKSYLNKSNFALQAKIRENKGEIR